MKSILKLFKPKQNFHVHELKPNMIKKVPNKELLNMHHKVHVLHGGTYDKNILKEKHELLTNEMAQRNMKHQSPLGNKNSRFSIQKHNALKAGIHYDLRLEKNGVLKSWAIKNLDQLLDHTKDKVLAVQVPDHNLNYIDFHGNIPEGSYGAGSVEIFDKGLYNTIKWEDGNIKVSFDGQKIKGTYALIKTKDNNWLILKTKEE